MDLDSIDRVLPEVADDVERDETIWLLHRGDVRMSLIADPRFDRMRVIAPIINLTEASAEQRAATLEANFHTTLDARYASSDGVLFATFMHPLSSLTTSQLRSAISQVSMLVRTFGTTYSSGALMFGQSSPDGMLH